MDTAILIPAYKPDKELLALCCSLKQNFLVTVVDDGSGEQYLELFHNIEELGVTVLRHETNRGKGAALKTGILYLAAQENIGAIVTADADGQHTINDITRMTLCMGERPGTIVLGGRDFSKMPFRSRFGNTMTRFFFRLCTGLKISDTQTGLRGLPRCLFDKLLALPGDRYEYEMNMLLAIKSWGAPYWEMKIATVYRDGNSSSHFHALRDGWRVFSRVIKYALSSLCCTAVDYALYLILLSFLSVSWSYACARICSAALNYSLNCKVVFEGKLCWKSFAAYALLALCSMAIGSAAVGVLVRLGLGSILSKLIIDCCLFIINYFVQKRFIFRRAESVPRG